VTRKERASVAHAIAEAEQGTTGRIVVRVIPDAAVDAFERAGLHRHHGANGVLVLVAPKARRFAIVGDRALHERVGDAFWAAVVAESQRFFTRGAIVEGVTHAVGRVGEALREHFERMKEKTS
jgi:uncharacterized membrane protein